MEGMISVRLVIAATVLTVLSVASGSNGHSCPSVCTCYVDELYGYKTANCSGVNFLSEYKYNKLFHEIEVLNLQTNSDDDAITLWDDMFLSFTKLKNLNLSKCKINYLPKNVFKGLKKIYEINLSYNNIKHFDNSVFENIYTLYKLSLRGNLLQASYKPFISSSSLRDLDLGYCGLTILQNEFFHGVKKVTRLHLDGNYLQTIKEHVLPRGITHLDLASNRIVSVPLSTISSLNQLRWINLGDNPINCTCSLLNLQDRLSGQGIIIDGDVRCAYPLELENISWSKINENELCNKETFRSKFHYRKSQTAKYAPKKDPYFENEEYSSIESFLGDDPGQSADNLEDYENNDDDTDDVKETKIDDNQAVNLEPDVNEEKPEDEVVKDIKIDEIKKENIGVEGNASTADKYEEKPQNLIENGGRKDKNNTQESEAEFDVLNDEHSMDEHSEKPNIGSSESKGTVENELPAVDHAKTEKPDKDSHTLLEEHNDRQPEDESTQPTMTTDPDIDVPEIAVNAKSNLDALDENLKKVDEILPVALSPPIETEANENTDKDVHVSGNNTENKDNKNDDTVKSTVDETENKSPATGKSALPHIQNENIDENNNHLEEIVSATKDTHHLNAGLRTTQTEKEDENHVNETDDGEKHFDSDSDYKSKEVVLSSTVETVAKEEEEEEEGSAGGPLDFPEGIDSIPVVPNDEKDVLETTIIPASEIPIMRNSDNNPVENVNSGEIDDINNESSRQIVDKESISFEAMGPYIVAAGIILLVVVLILVSIYKGLCKPGKNNRKPVLPDVEASNGTELQDMKSLLPQTPVVNGEKHNNKYPNEVPSPETVNLIKEDKSDDACVPNETHDLNQNDNRNKPLVKNGKASEGVSPPIEITKAKLTVLPESIPRTPIFVQKKPAAVN